VRKAFFSALQLVKLSDVSGAPSVFVWLVHFVVKLTQPIAAVDLHAMKDAAVGHP